MSEEKKKEQKAKAPAFTESEFLKSILDAGISLAHEPSSGRQFVARDSGDWLDLDSKRDTQLFCDIEDQIGKGIPIRKYQIYRDNHSYRTEHKPFEEWLFSLPKRCQTVEGQLEDLETWGCKLFGFPDTPLSRFIQLSVWAIPVVLALHPGARVRVVPIIVGGPRLGKSTFVEHMLPDHLRKHGWAPTFNLRWEDDKMARMLRGRRVVELDEVRGLTRADWADLKSITSQVELILHEKYQEKPSNYSRTWLFLGTANHGHLSLPRDSVAAERFLPIHAPQGRTRASQDPKVWLADNRDRFFRMALDYVRREGLATWDITSDLVEDHKKEISKFIATDEVDEILDDLLGGMKAGDKILSSEIQDVLPKGVRVNSIGQKLRDRGMQNGAKIGKARGWEKVMIDVEPTDEDLKEIESESECPSCANLKKSNPNSKGCWEHYKQAHIPQTEEYDRRDDVGA